MVIFQPFREKNQRNHITAQLYQILTFCFMSLVFLKTFKSCSYLCVWTFTCMSVCAPHACLVPMEAKTNRICREVLDNSVIPASGSRSWLPRVWPHHLRHKQEVQMLNGCQQHVIGLVWGDFDGSWNVFILEHLLEALFSGRNALGVHANQMNATIQCKTYLESCKLIS